MPPTRKIASVTQTSTQMSQIKEILSFVDVSGIDLLNEEPCSREEAAHLLGVGRDKVVEYAKNEGLPHFKVGKRYQFYKSLIRAWRLSRHLSEGKK